MGLLAYLIGTAISLYIGVVIIQIVIHWLVAFDVIKVESPQAKNLLALMEQLTDPVYRPLRKYIPPLGGIDITPIIVIIGLQILRGFIVRLLM